MHVHNHVHWVDNSHTVAEVAISSAKTDGLVYVHHRIPEWSVLRSGWNCHNWKYLVIHESLEKARMIALGFKPTMSADRQQEIYLDAHNKTATPGERRAVEADGGDWKEYSAHMRGFITEAEKERDRNPPPDPFIQPEIALGKGEHKGRWH